MRGELGAGEARARRALVFDSGLGGLSVLAEIERLRPDVEIVYAADDAAFPYGRLSEADLVARVETVMARLIAEAKPDIVVIACSTASTLALPFLRAAYPGLPFVGVVPAIKPAAAASRSGLISVLATRGTVARDYTRALVREHAGACEVTLVGSPLLALIAERVMRGETVEDGEIEREIAPCFVERDGRRTDQVVLACTHFPLILDRLARLAPWPVGYVDPAPAIARRLDALLGPARAGAPKALQWTAIFTSGDEPEPALQKALRRYGLAFTPAGVPGPVSA
jgi:glutamate racemase